MIYAIHVEFIIFFLKRNQDINNNKYNLIGDSYSGHRSILGLRNILNTIRLFEKEPVI